MMSNDVSNGAVLAGVAGVAGVADGADGAASRPPA